MRIRDFFAVVLAAVLWGGGGIVGVLLSRHAGIHPLSVAMWRMLVGGLALLILVIAVPRLRTSALGKPAWRRMVATGVLTALFEALYFSAIGLSSVGLATLIGIGSAPLFAVVFDWSFHRVRPKRLTVFALVLALAGLALLLSGSLQLGSNGLLGGVLAVANGATFAGLTVLNRNPVEGLGPIPLTAIGFTIGGVLLIPVAAVAGIGVASDATGWGLTLMLGIGLTAVAYAAFLTGLRTVPPFVATIVALLEPLVATVLGVLVLAERLGLGGMVGAATLGAAVVLLRPRKDEPQLATA